MSKITMDDAIFEYKNISSKDLDKEYRRNMKKTLIISVIIGVAVPALLSGIINNLFLLVLLSAICSSISTAIIIRNKKTAKLARKIRSSIFYGDLDSIFKLDDYRTKKAVQKYKNTLLKDAYIHGGLSGNSILLILNQLQGFGNAEGDIRSIPAKMKVGISRLLTENTQKSKILRQLNDTIEYCC